MKKLLYLVLLFSAPLALAQTPARFDLPVLTTTPSQVPIGTLPDLLAISNATVAVCGYPATLSAGMCTNTVTTYTDSSLGTACPSTAQLTAPGTNVCIHTTGLQGAFGFWYDSSAQAHMTYTVKTTWGTFGPFDILPGGGNGGGSGTVTRLSSGNLSPLFTTSVANPTTTPVQSFALSNAAQNSVLAGPATGGAGAPSYQTAPTISAANMNNYPYSALTGAPTIPTSASWPNAGTCPSGQYVSALANGSTPTCNTPSGGGGGTITPSPQFQIGYFGNSGTSDQIVGTPATVDTNGDITSPAAIVGNLIGGRYYADRYGTGSNGIETVGGSCGPQSPMGYSGCTVNVSPNYANTDVPQGWIPNSYLGGIQDFTTPNGMTAWDFRNSGVAIRAHNPVNPITQTLTSFDAMMNQTQDAGTRAMLLGGNAGTGTTCALCVQLTAFDGGWDWLPAYGGLPTVVNQDWRYGISLFQNNFTEGIDFGIYQQMTHRSLGDFFLQWGQGINDGGDLASNSEGAAIADWTMKEDPAVFTATITGSPATGATTIQTDCSIGCSTEGPGRLLINESNYTQGAHFTGAVAQQTTGSATDSAIMPPQVSDSTQAFPVSTIMQLCYPGSDNGAGGAAGCTSGSQPEGYIPPAGLKVTISAWSIAGNVATFTTSAQALAVGQVVTLYNFHTSTFFNNQKVTVLNSGLSSTSFSVNFTHANGSATEAGNSTYSPTGYGPPESVTLNIVPTYTGSGGDTNGLPAGFCTPSTLQSSNPSSACYLPASGVLELTDGLEYESVNYTYNAGAGTVTIANMAFSHLNGVMAAYGGMAGYAVEDLSSQYNSGGTTGTIDEVYAVAASLNATTFYYVPQRTNFQYGGPRLGGSTDGGSGNGTVTGGGGGTLTALCFSTGSSSYSASGDVVTFNMDQPAGTANPFPLYNNLKLNIATSNATYTASNQAVTWLGSNSFSYTLASAPTGAAPTSGTVGYCNAGYKVMPALRVTSVYNASNQTVDGTLQVMPNNFSFTNGTTVIEPHYQNIHNTGIHANATQYLPLDYYGGKSFDFTMSGTQIGATPGFEILNNDPATNYLGFGGNTQVPFAGFNVEGLWGTSISLAAPMNSALAVNACKTSVGCIGEGAAFNMLEAPDVSGQETTVPGVSGLTALIVVPQSNLAGKANGTMDSDWILGRTVSGNNAPPTTSIVPFHSGYVDAYYSVNAPTVNTSNLLLSQQSGITVFPNVVGTAGTTTLHYWIVGNAIGGGQAMPQEFTITNAPATLNSTNYVMIQIPYQPGWASYDILKGDTAHSVATGLSGTTPNGASLTPTTNSNYTAFYDQGASTTAYTAPTSNTTGGLVAQSILDASLTLGTSPICANGVDGKFTNVGCSGGGGGGLPTASAAGQAPVSTGAGTTYTAQQVIVAASLANYNASVLPITYGTTTSGSNAVTVVDASSWVTGEGVYIPATADSSGGIPMQGVACDNVTVSGNTLTMFNAGGSACNATWPSGTNAVPIIHWDTSHGAITTGSNTLTVTSAVTFTAGQGIRVAGAGAAGADLICPKIAISGTTFTLYANDGSTACNAGTTVSAAKVFHDDTQALKNALAAANYIRAPGGAYYLSSEIDITNGQNLYGDGSLQTIFLSDQNAVNQFVVKTSGVTLKDFGVMQTPDVTPTSGVLMSLCDGSSTCITDKVLRLYFYSGWDQFEIQNKAIQDSFTDSTLYVPVHAAIHYSNPSPYGDLIAANLELEECSSSAFCNTATGIHVDAADTSSWTNLKINCFQHQITIDGAVGAVDRQRFDNISSEGCNTGSGDSTINITKSGSNTVGDIQFNGGEFEIGATAAGLMDVGNGVNAVQVNGAEIYGAGSSSPQCFDFSGQNIAFTGNNVRNCGDAVRLESTATGSFVGNALHDNTGLGINAIGKPAPISQTNNTFSNNGGGNQNVTAYQVADNFAGAASSALTSHYADLGLGWAAYTVGGDTGTLQLNGSGQVGAITGTGDGYNLQAPASPDYTVSADLTISNTGSIGAVMGRMSTGADTLYEAIYIGGTGFQLYRVVAGTATQIGATYSTTFTLGTPYTISLTMSGTSISGLINGSTVIGPVTDTNITAAGYAGFKESQPYATTGNFRVSSDGSINVPTLTATNTVNTPQLVGTISTLSGATPAINAAIRDFTITLSVNATPTVSGILAGTDINAQICQPASGGPYTWAWPAAFHGGVTIGTTASTCSMQAFHSFNGTTLVPMSTGAINVAP